MAEVSEPGWNEEFVLEREDVPEESREFWDRAHVFPVPSRPTEREEERGNSNKAQ